VSEIKLKQAYNVIQKTSKNRFVSKGDSGLLDFFRFRFIPTFTILLVCYVLVILCKCFAMNYELYTHKHKGVYIKVHKGVSSLTTSYLCQV